MAGDRCECCEKQFSENERRHVTDDDVYLCNECWGELTDAMRVDPEDNDDGA